MAQCWQTDDQRHDTNPHHTAKKTTYLEQMNLRIFGREFENRRQAFRRQHRKVNEANRSIGTEYATILTTDSERRDANRRDANKRRHILRR
jgi:hypothetical protein